MAMMDVLSFGKFDLIKYDAFNPTNLNGKWTQKKQKKKSDEKPRRKISCKEKLVWCGQRAEGIKWMPMGPFHLTNIDFQSKNFHDEKSFATGYTPSNKKMRFDRFRSSHEKHLRYKTCYYKSLPNNSLCKKTK